MIHFYPETKSTNTLLRQMADANPDLPDFTAVRADFQTAGRGQVGNHWESQDGQNLLLSVFHRPAMLDVAQHFYVTMAVALGVCDSIAPLLAQSAPDAVGQLKVKWPNDIYVGDKKLAGILIENRLRGRFISEVVIGLGLNVNQTSFLSDAPNPISLANVAGCTFSVPHVAESVVRSIASRLSLVADAQFAILAQDYFARLYRANGQFFRWQDDNGLFSARLVSVDPDGRLTLADDNGNVRSYLFKEVEHVL